MEKLVIVSSVIATIAFVMIAYKAITSRLRHQSYQLLVERSDDARILQRFYELPFIGMAILEPEHYQWLRFNDRFRSMLNYSEQTLQTLSFFDLLSSDESEIFHKKFSEILEQNRDSFTHETFFVSANRKHIYVIVNIQAVRQSNGNVQYFLLTVQDTTELKHLSDRNVERQDHLDTVINTIPDLIWLKNVEGIYLGCNAKFETFFGAKEHQILGKTDYDFVDKALADFFREHDQKAMAAGGPTENEEWLTFADTGYHGLFSTVKTPMKNRKGEVIGVLGVARDITKRKEDEQRLARLTSIYSLLSHTNEAIIQCNSQAELFDRVCEIAVKRGEMKMAWIGWYDKTEGKISPVARAGEHAEYLQGLGIDIESNGPSAMAIKNNEPYWCQNFLDDEKTLLWRERGKEFGWRSSAAIPITLRSEVIGTLNLYSDVESAFDEGIKGLLTEMTANLSFALNNYVVEEERQATEFSRQEALARLQKIAGRLPGMIYQFKLYPDGRSCFPFSSDAIQQIYRVSPESVEEDASPVFEVLHPDDLETVSLSIQESATHLTPWDQEYRVRYMDGEVRWLYGNAIPQREQDGSVLWHGFITDITERRATEEQVKLSSKVFEQSREGIMITDPDLKILMVNDAFEEITGFSEQEVLGRKPNVLSSGNHQKSFYEEMWLEILEVGHWQGEIWNKHKSGKIYPEWLSISRGLDDKGEVSEYVGVFSDITQLKTSEEKIHRLAHYDPLTNLANRELLVTRLNHAIDEAQKKASSLAVLFIDLDHFKNINDTLGHYFGDEVLREVGKRITDLLGVEDTLARQGGDEFIAVLPNANENEAAHMSSSIIKSVSSEMVLGNLNLKITPSIGIAIYPQDGRTDNILLKNADTAMYQAKDDGRNAYRFFTPHMQEVATRTMAIESALRSALVHQEFELYYQPQVCSDTHELLGAEALIRWTSKALGSVSPGEFIPVAEQSGQIFDIGTWVLQTAIQQIAEWRAKGLPDVTISVNLSAAQFRFEALPDQIIQLLSTAEVPPECLTVELTETVTMSNPEAAVQMMDRLSEHGIQIAIDDFGTGYSSLSYLKKFKANKVKVDQSFVRDVELDPDDRSIIVGIISLAKSLGMKTIAEGVETPEQLAFLKDNACDEIQGYYFSKPMPAQAFVAYILTQKP